MFEPYVVCRAYLKIVLKKVQKNKKVSSLCTNSKEEKKNEFYFFLSVSVLDLNTFKISIVSCSSIKAEIRKFILKVLAFVMCCHFGLEGIHVRSVSLDYSANYPSRTTEASGFVVLTALSQVLWRILSWISYGPLTMSYWCFFFFLFCNSILTHLRLSLPTPLPKVKDLRC